MLMRPLLANQKLEPETLSPARLPKVITAMRISVTRFKVVLKLRRYGHLSLEVGGALRMRKVQVAEVRWS
jgi:hypothetical protein